MTNATPHPRRLATAALAALALGAAPSPHPAATHAPPKVPPFEQSIEVVETSVLVTRPAIRRVRDRDWKVRENGVERKVERVEELDDDAWELLIWVDGPLCEQAALARTLLALAHQAEAMTDLGSVRIVTASPQPETVLAATREPATLVKALAGLASQPLCSGEPNTLFWRARGMPRGSDFDPVLATPAKAAAALTELRDLVERRTALLAEAASPCQAAAGCALLLISHGYPLDPDLRLPPELRPADSAQLAASLATTTDGLARRLATSRWLVLALPFAPPPPGDQPEEAAQPIPGGARPRPEPFPDMGDHGPPGMPVLIHRPPAVAPPAAATDVYVTPEYAPLRRLGSLTDGLVLRVPEQLAPAWESLASRLRLWYRTAPFAAGEARSLEVRVRDFRAGAPAWVGKPP